MSDIFDLDLPNATISTCQPRLGDDTRKSGLAAPQEPYVEDQQDIETEPDGARPNRCPSNVTQTINPCGEKITRRSGRLQKVRTDQPRRRF